MQAPGDTPRMRDFGYFRYMVTDHRRTRQGIARRLMEMTLLHAHACGMTQLHCLSTFGSFPFYRAMGFVEMGEMNIELRPGIILPAIFMSRFLT